MNFSFTFTSVAVISSFTVTFGGGLGTGGPAVLVWSWIGTSFFTILVSLSMAEICSTYPTAGSVYHWASMLANQSLEVIWLRKLKIHKYLLLKESSTPLLLLLSQDFYIS